MQGAARTRTIGLVTAGLVVQLALVGGWLGFLPVACRIGLAFVTLILLPGFACVSLLTAPPGGSMLAPGWALGFGIAWNAAVALLTQLLGAPFTALMVWSVPLTALLWIVAIARSPAGNGNQGPALRGAALGAVLLAAALAAGYSARLGPPMTYVSDTPDHIGTLRRMLEKHEMFPEDAFFRDEIGRASCRERV